MGRFIRLMCYNSPCVINDNSSCVLPLLTQPSPHIQMPSNTTLSRNSIPRKIQSNTKFPHPFESLNQYSKPAQHSSHPSIYPTTTYQKIPSTSPQIMVKMPSSSANPSRNTGEKDPLAALVAHSTILTQLTVSLDTYPFRWMAALIGIKILFAVGGGMVILGAWMVSR